MQGSFFVVCACLYRLMGVCTLLHTMQQQSAGSPQFEEYATPFKSGDIVGVLVDMDKPSISFTLNEVDLGVAFAGDSLKGKTLVPAVCGGGANPAAGQSHRIRILESPTGFAPQRTSRYVGGGAGLQLLL